MSKKQNNNLLYSIIAILLIVIVGILIYFLGGNNTKTENADKSSNITIKVIDDKRCGDKCPDMNEVIKKLTTEFPKLKNAKIEMKDFSQEKDYIKENKIQYLPAIIFSQKNIDPQLNDYLVKLKNNEYALNIGATYDPFAEICDNKIDDNNDGKIDCKDPKCSKELICAPKVEKPKAELYVMSHCPYGTQAQKGYLEVMKKLGNVADVKVKFVDYLMHGEKEGQDNLIEYCIQEEQNDKFYDYLKCFLKEGDRDTCIKDTKIDEKKLNNCIEKTKKEINYDKNLADSTRRFPKFTLQTEDNENYNVQGSPTFVLNGIKVEAAGRSAKAYADLICNSFKNKPKECEQEFSNITYDPNFGFTSNGQNVGGGCGQ